MSEVLKQNPTPKPHEKFEKITIEDFSSAFKSIGEEYSAKQKLHPEHAKTLAIWQLKELDENIGRYKNNPNWQEYTQESRMKIVDMESNIRSITAFLSKRSERETVLEVIFNVHNDSLLWFLPEECKKNGTISNEVNEEAKRVHTVATMNVFLKEGGNIIPYFNNDDWQDNPEIITKALSRPGVIVNMYEWMKTINAQQKLREDTVFIKTLNGILAQEYPIFKEAQNKNWYDKNHEEFNLDKITTLLDIEKYGTPEQKKYFIEMMNGAEEGKTEKTLGLYEKYFRWKDIGKKIRSHFKDSQLIFSFKKDVLKMLDDNKERFGYKEWIICDIINKNKGTEIFFLDIPKEYLNRFLLLLPEIEAMCSSGNSDALKKRMASFGGIDSRYKELFFLALLGLSSIWKRDADRNFYLDIANYYSVNVTEEKEELSKQGDEYIIINQAFPGDENKEKRKQKNAEFKKFLNDTDYFSEWKFKVTTQEIKDRFGLIFAGTEIWEEIDKNTDGKIIFEILANGYKEEENFQEMDLKGRGFDAEKWKILSIIEKKEILKKFQDPKISTDEKIKILIKNWLLDIEKIPTDSQEKQRLIEELLKLSETTKNTSIFSEESFKDFSAAWKSGDFTEFNKKAQAREEKKEKEEIKKQEESQQQKAWEKNKITSHTDRAYDFTTQVQNNFSKIPVGETITTYIDNKVFQIRKDTDNGQSTVSWNGMEISGVNMSEIKSMKENINHAMDSMQFLKDSGLDIFTTNISKIIDAINLKYPENPINLTDGIDKIEWCKLLDSIANIANIEITEKWPESEKQLNSLRQSFIDTKNNGGLLSRLQNTWYATDGKIDLQKITEKIKQSV